MVCELGFVSEGTATYSLGSVQAGIATACKKYLALQCKRLVCHKPAGSMSTPGQRGVERELNDDPTNSRRPNPNLA